MKNLAALLAGVLVLAGVLWLALGGGASPAPAGLTSPAETARAAHPKPPPLVPAPARAPGRKTPPKAAGPTPPPRRKKVEIPPSNAPGPKTGWKVLVVEKATGKPVPGAEVLVLDISTVKDPAGLMREAATGGLSRMGNFLQKFGKSYRADSKGVAWIHPLRSLQMGALVAARKGNLWGILMPRKEISPPIEVQVSPVRELLVQVKDQRGKPVAGVPVGIGASMGDIHYFPMKSVTQGPEGIARFRHLDILFRESRAAAKGLAALLVPLKKRVEKEFDPKDLPKNPLAFTLPPTGRVEVYVRGPKGPMADGEAFVTVSPLRKEDGEKRFFLPPGAQAAPVVRVKGGKAVFPFVGLGLELEVKVGKGPRFMMMGSPKPVTVKGPGPLVPGQTVTFRVSLTQVGATLGGRLLLPSGKPASDQTLFWKLETKEKAGDSFLSSAILHTDKEGRFEFHLEEGRFQGKSRTLTLHLENRKSGESLEAVLDLGRDFPPGKTDLGDILLGVPGVLAAGRVLDPTGKPVPGAHIQVLEKQAVDPQREFFFWHTLTKFPVQTDEQGRFQAIGKSRASLVKVQVEKRGWFQPKDVMIPPGTRGLVLVLRRGGTVRASFLADPGVSLRDLFVNLFSTDTRKRRICWDKRISEKNQVVWEGLPPGSYDLEVDFKSGGKPLLEIKGIQVETGKEAEDPRLKDIDLRGKIRVLDLDIVDEEGNRINRALISWGSGWGQSLDYSKGSLVLLPREEGRTLWVTAEGYKPKKIRPAGRSIKVVLERGYKVRLVLDRPGDLPKKPYSLGINLFPLGEKGAGATGSFSIPLRSIYFGREGVLETWVSITGKYRISWTLKKGEGYSWSTSGLPVQPLPVIQVRDVPGVQVFHISNPVEAWKKAVEESKKGR